MTKSFLPNRLLVLLISCILIFIVFILGIIYFVLTDTVISLKVNNSIFTDLESFESFLINEKTEAKISYSIVFSNDDQFYFEDNLVENNFYHYTENEISLKKGEAVGSVDKNDFSQTYIFKDREYWKSFSDRAFLSQSNETIEGKSYFVLSRNLTTNFSNYFLNKYQSHLAEIFESNFADSEIRITDSTYENQVKIKIYISMESSLIEFVELKLESPLKIEFSLFPTDMQKYFGSINLEEFSYKAEFSDIVLKKRENINILKIKEFVDSIL